jgi:hypothetical protein
MAPPGIQKSEDDLVKMLRTFLGDTPEDNKLIPDKEMSDDKLKLALNLALDEYNNTPPFEQRTFITFPSLSIIIHGGAIQALTMAGIIQTRNFLNFSDGGIQEVISDKASGYQSWIGNLVGKYQSEALNLKTALNMEENFGIISSPYGNTFDSDFS